MGISTIAAILERKVWIDTGQKLYPNLYTILVGRAGIGKTRAIDVATGVLRQIPDFHLSPTSMTKAALVDCLVEAKRDHFVSGPDGRELFCWNSLFIAVDELSSFMSKWDHELVAGLTKFYDCNLYAEARRVNALRIKIENPQLNVLCGTTPAQLMDLIPPVAWGQGLMSRTILVYSDQSILKPLNTKAIPEPVDLIHDLQILSTIQGGLITIGDEWREAYDEWRLQGKKPVPANPRLTDYCARRETHLTKLGMIACVDWGDPFILTHKHFDRAMEWLLEAEANMSAVFDAGATIDSRNHDDIIGWLRDQGRPVTKHELVNRVRKTFATHMVINAIDIMCHAGKIAKDADGNWTATSLDSQ